MGDEHGRNVELGRDVGHGGPLLAQLGVLEHVDVPHEQALEAARRVMFRRDGEGVIGDQAHGAVQVDDAADLGRYAGIDVAARIQKRREHRGMPAGGVACADYLVGIDAELLGVGAQEPDGVLRIDDLRGERRLGGRAVLDFCNDVTASGDPCELGNKDVQPLGAPRGTFDERDAGQRPLDTVARAGFKHLQAQLDTISGSVRYVVEILDLDFIARRLNERRAVDGVAKLGKLFVAPCFDFHGYLLKHS